jgi:hypothetical protein
MLTYFATTIGLGATVKYCCGRVSAVEWFTVKSPETEKGERNTLSSPGCCTECMIQVQASPSVSPASTLVPEPIPTLPEAIVFAQEMEQPLPAVNQLHQVLDFLPGQPPPLFLMNSVFRI